MKKYGLLDKIPSSFKKKTNAEGGNEKNSTATGGEDAAEQTGDEMPDPKFADDGPKKFSLMNTI
jgi:hypothetical protein